MKKFPSMILIFILASGAWNGYESCTRVVYKGPENTVITARSMDWKDEISGNL